MIAGGGVYADTRVFVSAWMHVPPSRRISHQEFSVATHDVGGEGRIRVAFD